MSAAVATAFPEDDIRIGSLPRLVARIAAAWTLMAVFESSQRITRSLIEAGQIHWPLVAATFWDAAGLAVATYAAFLLADRYPMEHLTWRRGLFAVIPTVFFLALFTWVFRHLIERPFDLVERKGAFEDLMFTLHSRLMAVFLLLGVAYGVRQYFVLRKRTIGAARLEAEVLRAQIRMLRAELQPHFLFNTLNVIAGEVRRSPARAEELIGRLGDLLRMSLDSIERQTTSVSEEIEFVTAYLDLQRARLGDRLRTSIRVDNDAFAAVVPSFLLQPLVENAVRHGVEGAGRPTLVTIDVSRDGDALVIDVSDDGHGVTLPTREGLGLRHTRERLARQYGARASVLLEPRTGGGTRVVLRLPVE